MPWEYIVMSAIQSVSRLGTVVMDPLFAFFTFLGEETFLLVAVFSIYWCGNKKFGEYLFLSLYSSIAANGILKDLVRRPRPFLTPGWEELRYVQIDNPLINTVSLGESFSFPSGHSQCAGGFFTAVALWVRKRWVTVLAVLAHSGGDDLPGLSGGPFPRGCAGGRRARHYRFPGQLVVL